MLTRKRQEWILQMIKGPDITPVFNCPGHYTSKGPITIAVDGQEVTIRPADVLDLSNAEFLVVHTNDDRNYRIAWERITNLDFEEQGMPSPSERLRMRTAVHRMLPFPMGKKLI
jgi:hypothetical protein